MRKASQFLALLVALSVAACKHNKKVSKSDETGNQKQTIAVAPTPSEETKVNENYPPQEKEPMEQQKIKEPVYPDSLFFRMDRTPCFGACAVYRVNVYKSGYATLEGRKFFDFIGSFRGKLTQEQLQQLVQLALDAGYFDLNHVYDAPVTDLPSCTTVLNSDAGTNWVYNRMNSPETLRTFEKEAEEILKAVSWQEIKPIKDNMD